MDAVEAIAATRPFTDETAMSVAVGESLLFVGGVDQDHLARTFGVRHGRRPDRGYHRATASMLRRIGAGEHWKTAAAALPGHRSGRSSPTGDAAKRVSPIALWASHPAEVAALAHASAEVTHPHPIATDAAAVQAAAIHLATCQHNDEPLDPHRFASALLELATSAELSERLRSTLALASAAPGEVAAALGAGPAADEVVSVALCAFLRHPDSCRDAVRCAISVGGETGTTASMAGAVAGGRLGEAAVPVHWRAYTEGIGEVVQLADRIVARRDGTAHTLTQREGSAAAVGCGCRAEGDGSVEPEMHQIGEAAAQTGLSLRTIRFYEEVGLVPPSGRTAGGFRLYTDDDIERLSLVKDLKPLDFSLEEMREVLELRDRLDGAEPGSEDHAELRSRLDGFAEVAEQRCEDLRTQLRAAEAVAKQLRRESRRRTRSPR